MKNEENQERMHWKMVPLEYFTQVPGSSDSDDKSQKDGDVADPASKKKHKS